MDIGGDAPTSSENTTHIPARGATPAISAAKQQPLIARSKARLVLFLGWRHEYFVGRARQELELWNRVWPIFKEYAESESSKNFPDLKKWYLSYRHAAAKIQASSYITLVQLRTLTLVLIFTAFVLIPLGTRNLATYCVLLASGTLGAIAIELAMGLVESLTRRAYNVVSVAVCLSSMTLGWLAVSASGRSPNSILVEPDKLGFQQLLAYAPLAAGVFELVALLIAKITQRIRSSRYESRLMQNPDVSAISYLIDIIDDASPDAFVNYHDRSRMISYLQISARLVRIGIPKRVRLPDPGQRVKFEDRCHSASNWLRSLMLWVALPNPMTHIDLSNSCCQMVFVLISGRYDDLPMSNAEKPTKRQVTRTLWGIVRVIASGATPALVLIGVRRLGVTLDGSLGATATIFCIAWAAVTYLQLIDPMIGQRLSTMRDLLSTVRGSGPGNGAAK